MFDLTCGFVRPGRVRASLSRAALAVAAIGLSMGMATAQDADQPTAGPGDVEVGPNSPEFVGPLAMQGPMPEEAIPACIPPSTNLTSLVARMAADPSATMDEYVDRGASLTMPTRNVALAAPVQIPALAAQIDRYGVGTVPARQIAIGLGLAARTCGSTSAQAAQAIQLAVASIDDAALEAVFRNASGDVSTASIGAPLGGRGPSALPSNSGGGQFAIGGEFVSQGRGSFGFEGDVSVPNGGGLDGADVALIAGRTQGGSTADAVRGVSVASPTAFGN